MSLREGTSLGLRWDRCAPVDGHETWVAVTQGTRSVAFTTRTHKPEGLVYSTLRISPFETRLKLW